MERDGTRKESKVKRAKRRGGGEEERRVIVKERRLQVLKLQWNPAPTRRVGFVWRPDHRWRCCFSFAPNITLHPLRYNFVFRGNCKPAANYQVILFHILPYSHTLSINEIKEINFKNRVFNYFQIFQYSPFSGK